MQPYEYPYRPPTATLTLRLEQELLSALRRAGNLLHASQSGVARYAVEQWVNTYLESGALVKMSAEERSNLAFEINSPVRRKRMSQGLSVAGGVR
jgi:hypothetical protein